MHRIACVAFEEGLNGFSLFKQENNIDFSQYEN